MPAFPVPASTTIDVFASSTSDVSPSSTSSTSTASMVAFPIASPSSLVAATAAAEPSTTISAAPVAAAGFPDGARDAILATTIVGGTFLIALALCVFLSRRRRRRKAERQRIQDELEATTRPRKRLPSFDTPVMTEVEPVPAGVAERFRRKDAYIKATLGEAYPMHSDLMPPPRALTRIDESETYRESMITEADETPFATAHLARASERWSWTNSQAPGTPRMYAPTLASSRNSGTRFRMAVNWVKTQGERITSGEMPSGSKLILPRPGVLKNQASKPNLAPRKLVKRSSQIEKETRL